MYSAESLCGKFLDSFRFEPTPCQRGLFESVARLLTSDNADTLVVNGYAGTGKTSAVAAVIDALRKLAVPCTLLAPTGRAAKVLAGFAGGKAYTIHKVIFQQKGVGDDGFGKFSMKPNKSVSTLFVVDEASLIGTEDSRENTIFGSGNLLEDLVTFVRSGSDNRLILIGDDAQLPPVGMDVSPALSPDFMGQFGGVDFCALTTVVRQQQESGILANATALRSSLDCGSLRLTDGYPDVERITGDRLIEKLTDAYSEYGEDDTIVLCLSNKRAIRYNLGIRATVLFKEEQLLRGDRLMVVKNCYQFVDEKSPMEYMANGDTAHLVKISHFEERYGLHFADATLSFPDYDFEEVRCKVVLDTLTSESASLTYEQQNALYRGVDADYSHIRAKAKRYQAVREDPFFNAVQLKYASAVTCHKSQGGQWSCVFIDCPFWLDEQTEDDFKWMYTALTRAVKKVYLVNFPDKMFV